MKSSNLEECVLCCREIRIYAVGSCDHPVCYECSARMRVLCETNECPICRTEIPIVLFMHQAHTFFQVSKDFKLFNKKYKINFEDETIKKEFELLLENRCQICEEVFSTFEKLKEHVRRKHELFYCELCSDNLKIFTFERKCYNRKDLARHKIKGDPDLTSHRGHPLCEFCDMRYVDNDDLYRHLRREHFFCHFCDVDGLNQYYRNYDYLKVHFRTGHYLCEEGDCANEKFTAVFRTEIDLKAHKALQHNKNKTKAEARQARTLDFEFNYVHNSRPIGNSSPRGRRYPQQRRNNSEDQNYLDKKNPKKELEVEPLNTQSTQDFPYLSEEAGKPAIESLSLLSFHRTPVPATRSMNMFAKEFPALCSVASDDSLNQNKTIDYSSINQNHATSAKQSKINNFGRGSNALEDSKPESKSINKNSHQVYPKWISKKDNSNFEEAFPKLDSKVDFQPAVKPVDSSKNDVLNHTPMAYSLNETVRDNLQDSEDQFVVIKKKSKMKKQKELPLPDEEEGDFYQNKLTEQISSLNNYCNLNDQENKDPFKRPMQIKPPRDLGTWETKVSFGKDDFPPLEVKKKPPPGLKIKKSPMPPPGFTNTSSISSNSSLSLSSIARIVENSLKHNINSVDNVPDPSKSSQLYMEPPNFQERNIKLFEAVKYASGTSENLHNFKRDSKSFREGSISASEYYGKCLTILGEDEFQEIFPEMVSLLPDILKQQELLTVHNKYLNNYNTKKKKFKAKNSLLSCTSCNQVLLLEDNKNHNCA